MFSVPCFVRGALSHDTSVRVRPDETPTLPGDTRVWVRREQSSAVYRILAGKRDGTSLTPCLPTEDNLDYECTHSLPLPIQGFIGREKRKEGDCS